MAFTHENRLKNLPDIQRSYMWELYIPSIEELDMDEMVVRIKNVQLPGRTITPIESYFMGSKSFFPGRTEYTGTLTVDMEEHEDQKVYTALNSWQELLYNYDTGTQGVASKNDLVKNLSLIMYKANGVKLGKKVVFHNAWPQAVADTALDYTAGEAVRINVTFQYDYWRVVTS